MHAFNPLVMDEHDKASIYAELLSQQSVAAVGVDDDDDIKESENDNHPTLQQLQQTYAGLIEWFEVNKIPPPLAGVFHTQLHACTCDCSFYRTDTNSRLYVCKISGNVHFCTRIACEYINFDTETDLCCSLTGVIHGVLLKGGGQRSKQKDGSLYTSKDEKVKHNTSMKVSDQFVKNQNHAPVKPPKKPLKKKKKNTFKRTPEYIKVRDTYKHENAIKRCVTAILEHVHPLKSRATDLYNVCLSVWKKYIVVSREYQQHPGKYDPLYHCLIVFNHMQDGLYIKGTRVIIEQDAQVRLEFPDIKDVIIRQGGEDSGVVIRRFTKTKKILKQAVAEFITKVS